MGDEEVFLSYAHQDGGHASEIASAFQSKNVRAFAYGDNVPAGENWMPRTLKALESSKLVICLMSAHALASKWVHAEIGAAWALKKRIVPAIYDVDARDLIQILSHLEGRSINTPDLRAKFIEEMLQQYFPHAQAQTTASRGERFTAKALSNLIAVGAWNADPDTQVITGSGMRSYLLSSQIYRPPFKVTALVRFRGFSPESTVINAGIVLGWTVPNGARRYHNICLNQRECFFELIGGNGRDEYLDFEHIGPHAPMVLKENVNLDISVSVDARSRTTVSIESEGKRVGYRIEPKSKLVGRVGIRPWRSTVEIEEFGIELG